MRRSTHYFPELESLRGVAIMLVFLHHANGMVDRTAAKPGTLVSPWWSFVVAGHTGVTLFFILSGFLLSLPFLAEAAGGKRVRRGDYYVRRVLRIVPLYYATVLAATLLTARRPGQLVQTLPYLAFVNFYGALGDFLWPYSIVWWSLTTEVQFYLLLPLLPLLLRSRRGRWIGGALLVAYCASYAAFLLGAFPVSDRTFIRLSHFVFGRAPLFGLGILAAWLYQRHGTRLRHWAARAARFGIADAVLLVLLIAFGFLLRWVAFCSYFWAELGRRQAWHLLEGTLWTGIVLLLLLAPLRLRSLLSNRALAALGVVSYSVYMIHLPLLYFSLNRLQQAHPSAFTGWTATAAGTVCLLAVGCIALSTLTYWTVERPFLVRKARIDQ